MSTKIIKQLTNSKLIRNIALVASGTAGAQAITMAASPVVTRLYGPEAFGMLGAFSAILGIVMPVAALSYPIAIVLPKSDNDAKAIARLSFKIALTIALLLSVLLLVAGNQIAELLGMEVIASFMLLIPVAMFFNALQQIMQQWLIRKKQFQVTARIAVSQSLILNSSKVGVGWFYPLGSVLIVLATLGNALYAAQLWFGAKRWADEDGRIDRLTKKYSLKKVAHEYRDFPYYRAPQVFLDGLSQSVPVLALAAFAGPAAAGFYTLARTVLGVPSTLIGKAVADVFYPHLNEIYHNKEKLTNLLVRATFFLALIGTIPFGIVILWGPYLFSFVFGSEWFVAGEYARWLSVWLFFSFCNRPSIAAIPVLRMQGLHLILNIIGNILRVIALIIGFYVYESAIVAIIIFSLVYAIMNINLVIITILRSRLS